ncbi:hypothetical protein COCON_G00214490 [Conger conger]|uniref:Uncharacterized protein n=1 Tax=Conger conger TaxID=82655 RepID=A0A9Q1HM94_CONCO|nr:hypothetical protein COCON_G00214490 [Conger conger]
MDKVNPTGGGGSGDQHEWGCGPAGNPEPPGGLSAAPARAVSAVKIMNLPEIPENINVRDINIKPSGPWRLYLQNPVLGPWRFGCSRGLQGRNGDAEMCSRACVLPELGIAADVRAVTQGGILPLAPWVGEQFSPEETLSCSPSSLELWRGHKPALSGEKEAKGDSPK